MNVLIVDDDPTNMKLLCAILEQEGHTVVQAADGIGALEALERYGADAIISDILMPGMDGNRLCLEVRKSKRFKKIPYIVYTATYTSASDEKLSLDLGADVFLRKPAPAAQIFDALQKASCQQRDADAQSRITMPEVEVMKEYNEQLVNKLEEKNSDLTLANDQLERRAREQSFMARFALDALQASSIEAVCDNATHILVENMAVDFSAVFQCTSDGKSMLLRSGVGWRPGHVGVTRIDRAPQLIQPIIIGDLRRDARLPQFMREHGVSSHMAVVIPGVAGGFGVLGVETRSPRAFSAHDVHFVESIGNVLATAISRLQFEDKLRDTAERLRGFVDTVVDGIITIDECGIVQTMNPAAEGIFGYPADEVIGRSVSMLMPEPYHSEHAGYLERYRKTGEPHIIGTRREVRGRRKDGSEFPLDLAVSVDKRRIFTGLMRDISERRRLEHEILEISDREQRRIGNDLHDDLCQRLAAIRFSCDALKSSLGNTAKDSSDRVVKIATSVSEAIDRARMLAHGLSPVALESNGLASALQELTDGVQKLFGIECTFESKGKIALTDTMTGTHLYRIAQEAINNALKHGHSSRLLVTLKEVGNKAALTIHDNGAGFSVDGQQSHGVGLRTISYRADMIGADLQVKSKPGQGTTIVCTFSPNP